MKSFYTILILFSFIETKSIVFFNKDNTISLVTVDTFLCKLDNVSSAEFNRILEKKLENDSLKINNSFTNGQSYIIGYFRHINSSGSFLFLQLKIDSNGNVLDIKIQHNLSNRNKLRKKIDTQITSLKRNKFKPHLNDTSFYVNNCYVSDGSDLFVYFMFKNQVIRGINYDKDINNVSQHSEYLKISNQIDKIFLLLLRSN